MKKHKTMWTWLSGTGGVLHFKTREAAQIHALNYGGFGIYAPIYGD